MRTLSGKVAVVTGGGSGIGRAIAIGLAGRGVRVAVCDLNEVAASGTSTVIAAAGGTATAHVVDVASEADMLALPRAVLEAHPGVDIVVNNAAIAAVPAPLSDLNLADFRRLMDVNFWGVVHGCVAFTPYLHRQPEASLVNISSLTALLGVSWQVQYTSSKFAVRGFTETLRMELRGSGVRVTLVCPGVVRTNFLTNSPLGDESSRVALQQHYDHLRGISSPDRVAERVVRGIELGRPRVLVGPDAVASDLVARLMPGDYSRLLRRPTERMLRQAMGARAPGG